VKISSTNGQNPASEMSVKGPQTPTSALEAPRSSAAAARARDPRERDPGEFMSLHHATETSFSKAREPVCSHKGNPEIDAVAAGAVRIGAGARRDGSQRSQVGRLPERDAVAA